MSPPSIGRVASIGALCSRRTNCGDPRLSDKEALGIQPKADGGEPPLFHELAKSSLEPNLVPCRGRLRPAVPGRKTVHRAQPKVESAAQPAQWKDAQQKKAVGGIEWADCLRKVINVQIGPLMVAGWGLDAASDRIFAPVHRIVDEIGAIGKRSATERDALGAQARQGLHW
jgi:hypothetical protein